jgi:undecaprenyl-diphosphatase
VDILDYAIFSFINGLAHKSPALDAVMIFSSAVLPYYFVLMTFAVFAVGAVSGRRRLRENAAVTVTLVSLSLTVNFLFSLISYVPRPFTAHRVNMLLPHAADTSFPSDHAAFSMSAAAGLARADRLVGCLSFAAALLIGFSRVYVGHHYPSDIIGSYIIVFAVNALYGRYIERNVRRLYSRAERRLLRSVKS